MYTDFREINALYHYGIKGQKWGVIRKEDETSDKEKKITSEYELKAKKYDVDLAAAKDANLTDLKIAREQTKQTVANGAARVGEAVTEVGGQTIKTAGETYAKVKKYMITGAVTVAALLLAAPIINAIRGDKATTAPSNNMKEVVSKHSKPAPKNQAPIAKKTDGIVTINKPLWEQKVNPLKPKTGLKGTFKTSAPIPKEKMMSTIRKPLWKK